MKSLLRYPGGKTRAIKILEKYIPENTKRICSPFFGGGSFELYLSSKGIEVHGYDIFKPLVYFWQTLKCDRWFIYNYVLQYLSITKSQFYKFQETILEYGSYPKEMGAIFYILNRCSFSGSTLSGGISPNTPRFNQASIDRVKEFKMPIDVNYGSFEHIIPMYKDWLIFADPPYYISQSLYGNKGDTHTNFNHHLLADILIKHGNFVLTYNDCPEIRELYKGCKFDIVEWAYGMNTSKKSNEAIITPKD